MEREMNVWLFVHPGVALPLESYASPPYIRERLIFADKKKSLLWEGGHDQAIATVSFGYDHGGDGRSFRVLEFYDEREGFDPNLPSLVVCAAGVTTWCGSDIRCEFGGVGRHYASVSILKPGMKPDLVEAEAVPSPHNPQRYLPPSNLGGIVLGSWSERPPESRIRPMLQVVLASFNSIQESPDWEQVQNKVCA